MTTAAPRPAIPWDKTVRKDAALLARIYRAAPLDCCPGDESESALRADRNRIARGNARQFVRTWIYRNEVK